MHGFCSGSSFRFWDGFVTFLCRTGFLVLCDPVFLVHIYVSAVGRHHPWLRRICVSALHMFIAWILHGLRPLLVCSDWAHDGSSALLFSYRCSRHWTSTLHAQLVCSWLWPDPTCSAFRSLSAVCPACIATLIFLSRFFVHRTLDPIPSVC